MERTVKQGYARNTLVRTTCRQTASDSKSVWSCSEWSRSKVGQKACCDGGGSETQWVAQFWTIFCHRHSWVRTCLFPQKVMEVVVWRIKMRAWERSSISDFFLTSAHLLSEDGMLIRLLVSEHYTKWVPNTVQRAGKRFVWSILTPLMCELMCTLHQKESAVGSAHQPAVWSQRERCEGTHLLGESWDVYVYRESISAWVIQTTVVEIILFPVRKLSLHYLIMIKRALQSNQVSALTKSQLKGQSSHTRGRY